MNAAVIGAGAWGTALACVLAKNGHRTALWFRNPARAAEAAQTRCNPRLPGVTLPENVIPTADMACAAEASLVVLATPSVYLRETAARVAPFLAPDAVVVSVTKGIEQRTLLRMSEVVREVTGCPAVALSGPCHAEEVVRSIPTGCVAACADRARAEAVQNAFMSDTFRVYTSPDSIGVELGGALKNVIALCAGVTAGLGFGDNTLAMLMTRGLTEIARLGVSMGAQRNTLAGLSGVGDLIVTCTSRYSRNRRAGLLIGQGATPEQALQDVGAVVEGYYAAASAYKLSLRQGIDMPITRAAHSVLYGGADARRAVSALLARSPKPESEDAGWA